MRIALLLCALLLVSTGSAQDAALPAALEPAFAAIEPRVIAWRRDFHQHPELSNREFETARKVADHLRALGLEVETGVAHTGVVGVLRGGKPGPVVALRADMDALPVEERVDVPFASRATGEYNGETVPIMHACGHDTHVAILMGTAEVLASMRDEVGGTVKFIFQPAEEGVPKGEEGGAELMVKEGALKNPDVDAIFALHIGSEIEAGHIEYTPRGMWASVDDFRIVVRGRQTHGAYPWNGADPIVAAAHIVTALQTVVSRNLNLPETGAAIVTVGKISGGVRSNIIPEEVEMLGTLRALDADARKLVHQRVREIAEGVARSLGVEADVAIPYSASYPVTYNDPDLTAAMLPALEKAAPGRVQLAPARTGAEDFSFFAQEVPGFYFRLGGRPAAVAREDAPAHHTPDFFVDERGLITGVRAFTALTLHYLQTHPSVGRR